MAALEPVVKQTNDAAATTSGSLSKLTMRQRHFIEADSGRSVTLRGVALCGDSMIPTTVTEAVGQFGSSSNTAATNARPFPIEEADEHFQRLQSWGFNCVKLVTSWEAIEHKGPNEYDYDYLDYLTVLCRKAGDYGLYVIIDFHQNAWSRMTGGNGAPAWIFEKLKLDYRKFMDADASFIVENNPKHPEVKHYWFNNYKWPANGLMWTLFFGGNEFTPDYFIDGENVQDYLQNHFIQAQLLLAERLKDMNHVIGFDVINEPYQGWIGYELDERGTMTGNHRLTGYLFSPIDSLRIMRGHSVDVPLYDEANWPFLWQMKEVDRKLMNPHNVAVWADADDSRDPFERAGVWEYNDVGGVVNQKDFFKKRRNGEPIDFIKDCLLVFYRKAAKAIHAIRSDWMILIQTMAYDHSTFPSDAEYPRNAVYERHWKNRISFLQGRLSSIYESRTNEQRHLTIHEDYINDPCFTANAKIINGGCPTLIGEFGVAFTPVNKRTGDPWLRYQHLLDELYGAFDTKLFSSIQWNYVATRVIDSSANNMSLLQRLYSIYDPTSHSDMSQYEGGRGLKGVIRPYPRYVQGELKSYGWNSEDRTFFIRYQADTAVTGPTLLFVPSIQYPTGTLTEIEVTGPARIKFGDHLVQKVAFDKFPNDSQMIEIIALENGSVAVELRRPRSGDSELLAFGYGVLMTLLIGVMYWYNKK
eukprot:TRINITY_DN4880_c0_g1_i2.p1 TRINITY_DN4880_c0_g1~~TRINITY_DN4880_c0_g1_i2.p1  ORF type:complete len:698 (-),score=92.74 TRINITY_DN4880_c0_g1_i2:117-2210(-)